METPVKYKNSYLWIILFIALATFLSKTLEAQPKLAGSLYDTSLMDNNLYSRGEDAPATRILFDFYHHHKPDTKVGNYLVTGSWLNSSGRYAWDDFVHTNSMDPLFITLDKNYKVSMLEKPVTPKDLSNAKYDAFVMVNPDNPKVMPESKVLKDEEISCIEEFVKNGGSLMVMINAGKVPWESFEDVQLRKLVRIFGLDWNEDNTHGSTIDIGDQHPYFYDINSFHYGGGCTLKILPTAKDPKVLMNVYADKGYKDEQTKIYGPGMVIVRYGKGKVILIGDTGSFTGNMERPWDDNDRLTRQLFSYLKPDKNVHPAKFEPGQSLQYEMNFASLQAIPTNNTLIQIQRKHFRSFMPRPITKMPYLEASANLILQPQKQLSNEAVELKVKVGSFRFFDEKTMNGSNQDIDFVSSRQGKVSGIDAKGENAKWLTPAISSLVALLPVDGIRPGDHWPHMQSLRVPIFQGQSVAPQRKINMDYIYEGDQKIDGKSCRLLRASGAVWLDDAKISVDDLLSGTPTDQVNRNHYIYYNPHGGRLLYKCEQWVDAKTGIVIKAKIQSRVVAWIRDNEKPLPPNNDEIDDHMIVSLAEITTFQLK